MPRPKGVKNEGHEDKRRELLLRMLPRFIRRDVERPSLRQLAAAAGVSVPTLRHYFGGRSDVVAALLTEYRSMGEARLRQAAEPAGDLHASVRDFAHQFVRGMQAERQVRLGDMFAASLTEGLLDPAVSATVLQTILDPSIDALQARLGRHIEAGQMRQADTRAAALMLLSPLLVAVLHQDQLCGRNTHPLDLPTLADELASSFVRAYAA